jgi:NAD(P)-dependent dehydrogenase (short-subunit alcohol dehydrogenase family)
MNGKVAVVTGANGGLGKYVTRDLLKAGATVVGVSRNIKQSDFAEGTFTALQAELSSAKGAHKMVESILAQHGRVDIVAHTVGGFAGGHSIAETDDAMFLGMLEVNLNSTFYLLRALLPAMRKTGGGRIVAIGSRAAVDPGPGVGAYSASKAAMVSLMRTVAAENKEAGITANVILPGTMDTPNNRKFMPKADFSKWVQPASVASLITWLVGDSGKDVNGAVIPVYGTDL